MYIATYINPIEQFDYSTYDLLLDDDEGILPSKRIYITLPIDSEDTLESIAEYNIQLALQEVSEEE